jgi:AraC-like DNA-binding protein
LSPPWSGRLWLGSSWMLYAGPVAPTAAHAHHAFQIALSGVQLEPMSPTDEPCWLVVPLDCPHAVVAASERAQMLYLDPESVQGRQLARRVARSPESWPTPAARLPAMEGDPAALVRTVLEALGVERLAPRALHPAVRRVVDLLPSRLTDAVPPALPELAQATGVSQSHLSRLLAQQLGLGLPAYVRWLRLRLAAQALARGESLTEAAHAAGFADSAHFTRTFRAMFGLTPSSVSRFATWTVL